MTVCVYAITRARRAPRLTGARGERLVALTVSRLSALVAPSTRPWLPAAATMRRYHQAIARAAEALPAILPARFGTVMEADEVAFVLRSRTGPLAAALTHVRGRVQVTIRLAARKGGSAEAAGSSESRTGSRRSASGQTGTSTPHSGAEYLRARATAAALAREADGFEPVRAAVAKWVKDERLMRHRGIISIYHLVPRRAVPAYVRTLQHAAREAGVVIAVSGPFPPYAFADPSLL
jgi:hypothetical protein